MHDIIFVIPPPDTGTFEGRVAKKGGILPHLGLLALTAYARREGLNIALLDAFSLGLSFEDTVKEVLRLKTKAVGITAFTTTIKDAAKVAGIIKSKSPEINIILGGNHISALPLPTMNKFLQFDIGVIGEGEITITELLKGKKIEDINGIIYRDNGRLTATKKRDRIKDLDKLPFPAFDLLPDFPHRYSAVATNFKMLPTTSLVTSRGCPYRCTFCDRHVFENICKVHSADYIIGLINELQGRYGIKDISFYDDTFVVFKKRLRELCQRIIKERICISWSCLARVDLIDPEILKLMKDAGCWQVSYGIESGNQEILNLYQKDITVETIKTATRMTKKSGLSCRGFFMLGNPLETKSTIKDTEAIAKDFDDIFFAFFTPRPGTEIHRDIKKYGEASQEWSKMDMFTPNFIPYGLTKKYLLATYRKIHIKFYVRPKMIYRYILKIIKNREIKKILSGFGVFIHLIFRRQKN